MDDKSIKRIIHNDPKIYIETYFNVKSKEREIVPFILNPIQQDYLLNRSYIKKKGYGGRDIILKGRQHGFTTLILALFLFYTLTSFGVTSVIVGHDESAMEKLLENARLMYTSITESDRPELGLDNKGELFFPKLNSRLYISTYRMLKLRSQTINNLLMTETAFWTGKTISEDIAGMTESVPLDGNIVIESTPNGLGGYFWKEVKNTKLKTSVYKLFTYPWYINKTYRIEKDRWDLLPESVRPDNNNIVLDKRESDLVEKYNIDLAGIMWRRYKMVSFGDMRVDSTGSKVSCNFSQEYSCDFLQSGNPVFDAAYLFPSCNFAYPVKHNRYVHGGDTSEGVEGGNYSVLYTMDFDTGECVHKIRGLWKPGDFAKKCHEVGMMYGGLVGVEVNNTGHAVLLKLVELFEDEAVKIMDKKDLAYDEAVDLIPYRIYSDKKKYGWSTNQLTRKTMFLEGEEALREGYIKLAHEDEEGIEELTACQYNELMKEEAPEGMYDDSVMALLIAWQMRKYYHFYFKNDYDKVTARIV